MCLSFMAVFVRRKSEKMKKSSEFCKLVRTLGMAGAIFF